LYKAQLSAFVTGREKDSTGSFMNPTDRLFSEDTGLEWITVGMVCGCRETEGIVVVFEFFKMECSRGAVVTLVPSGDREALMKSLPE
jgi:hypothetical protein